MLSIFKTFFALGWISFGGPAAHIGYFRKAFVEKRHWLNDEEYAQLIALSQFLPGPGSSQVGFALGYKRGGIWGAIMAFTGFTLPSVLIMIILAVLSSQLMETSFFQHLVHGLKLLAVVIVADAAWAMYKSFCKTKLPIFICLVTAISLLVMPGITTQMLTLIFAALVGVFYLCEGKTESQVPFKPSMLPLLLFVLLFFGLPFIASSSPAVTLFSEFFNAGSLVFGGGHVVMPLLQNIVGDQLSQDAFITGYAAAQAVPGPMFTFATYIGYELMPDTPIIGALLATVGVFLPGFLLQLSVLKNWQQLASKRKIRGAMNGINAAVVGLLLSALYQPVFSSAVINGLDLSLVLIGFFLLKQLKLPIVGMVLFFVASGLMVPMITG